MTHSSNDQKDVNEETYKEAEKDGFLTCNSKMKKILQSIKDLGPHEPTVLLIGETGTGKTMLAEVIHKFSTRNTKPFVPLHCGAVPGNLIESELFGYKKGAFTGALSDTSGIFKIASDGTCFLDEITETSHEFQTKLLQVLSEKVFRPVGSNSTTSTNARIIAATNKDLGDEVSAGRFRSDLYYRLHVILFKIPPLRERKDDIVLLANHFMGKYDKKKELTGDAITALKEYHWPGNIRELESVIGSAYFKKAHLENIGKDEIESAIEEKKIPHSPSKRPKQHNSNMGSIPDLHKVKTTFNRSPTDYTDKTNKLNLSEPLLQALAIELKAEIDGFKQNNYESIDLLKRIEKFLVYYAYYVEEFNVSEREKINSLARLFGICKTNSSNLYGK